MKFHRPLLVAGLASIGSVLFVARAQNTDAQNKALDALRRAQSGEGAAPAALPGGDSSAQEKALQALHEQQSGTAMPTMKAMKATPVAGAPARMVVLPSSGSAQEKALQALHEAQSPVMPADSAAQQRAIEALYGGQPTGGYAPANVVNSAKQSQAVEALHQGEMMETTAMPAKIPAKAPLAQRRAVNAVNDRLEARDGAASAPGQISTPRILTPKEEKLADLTRRYKADQISPHQYHEQRAKIIAEP